jgi:hypothetical protein
MKTADRHPVPGILTGDFSRFLPFLAGGGYLASHGDFLRLAIPEIRSREYADAQIDDYHNLRRSRFPWRPPLRLRVRARMSHPAAETGDGPGLLGTAGFGFWNDPFTLTGGGVLAAPSVLWFFYASRPADLRLVEGVPGWGWKAAVLDSARVPALLLAPVAALAVLLTKIPGVGGPVIRLARRAMRASETLLSASLTDWHDYEIDWAADAATFRVDGAEVLRAPNPPRGPLGFVAWVDNQYAIATPEGRFGFGVAQTPEPQWMDLAAVTLAAVEAADIG